MKPLRLSPFEQTFLSTLLYVRSFNRRIGSKLPDSFITARVFSRGCLTAPNLGIPARQNFRNIAYGMVHQKALCFMGFRLQGNNLIRSHLLNEALSRQVPLLTLY